MKNLLWYLVAGTRGGITRGRILDLLRKHPSNANRIAEILHLDYKTVRHHLNVLEKNNVIYAINKKKYGAVYFISEMMTANMAVFDDIWERIGRNLGKS